MSLSEILVNLKNPRPQGKHRQTAANAAKTVPGCSYKSII